MKQKYRYQLRIIIYGLLSIFCFVSRMIGMGLIFLFLTAVYIFLSFVHRNDMYTSMSEFAVDMLVQKHKEKKQSKKEEKELQKEQLDQLQNELDEEFEDDYEDEYEDDEEFFE